MRTLPVMLLLAACTTTVAGANLPSRDTAAAAVTTWATASCAPDEAACLPQRVTLRTLRCTPAPDDEQPSRVLCTYSGDRLIGARSLPIANECAYFVRDAARRWRLTAYPDADLCE